MKSQWYARASALALAAVVSSMAAATSWSAAGDNGQYFLIEGLWLTQDDDDAVALTQSTGNGAPDVPFRLVTTDNLDLEDSGGIRATVQFENWDGAIWQVSAFAVTAFEADFVVNGLDPSPGGINGTGNTSTTYARFVGGTDTDPFGPGNSDEFEAMQLHQEAELWGAEVSWVKNLTDYGWHRVDMLLGIRYIHYGEDLTSSVFDEPDDLTFDNDIDDLTINIDNDLIGFQIGFQSMWDISPTVSLGGTLKGGIGGNFVSRDRLFVSQNGGLNYADSVDDEGFAQFAEFNPRLEVILGDSATLSVAGTVLWINETTRAADHYQSVANRNDRDLRDDDDQLFYGASVGLRLALN